MKKKDFISGLFWFGVALVVIWQALDLRLGSYRAPGPGFIPLGVGLGMAIMSQIILVQALLSPPRLGSTVQVSKTAFKRLGFILAILLTCAILFPHLGFLLTTFLLLILLFKSTESQSWPKSLLLAGTATVFTYFLFTVLLSVELPRGILGM